MYKEIQEGSVAKSYMVHTLFICSYMVQYLRIYSYFRKPFLIYDSATDPILISSYMRNISFSFLSVWFEKLRIKIWPDTDTDPPPGLLEQPRAVSTSFRHSAQSHGWVGELAVFCSDEGVYYCKAENSVGSVAGTLSLIVHGKGDPWYMSLQPIPSEFPCIWGKFRFHFYQCGSKN